MPITIIGGVITLRNMLARKNRASRGRGAQRGRRAAAGRGHDPHGETAKEQRRNHVAEPKSSGVVQNPVALEHVPDFGAARLAP